MYFRIKDDKVYDHSDIKFDDACVYSDLCTKAEYDEHPNKYMIGDVEEQIKVYEYEKKTIEVPIYNEEGEIIGYEKVEVDDLTKPIMVEDTETGELVHKFHYETVITKGLVLNPDFEEEEATRREAEFNKAFFNTSLGYIRRIITNADGSHANFLYDIVPAVASAVSLGLNYNLIVYSKPDFTEDITDWTPYQSLKPATPQFIQECVVQIGNDFKPQN